MKVLTYKSYRMIFVTNNSPNKVMHYLDAFNEIGCFEIITEYLYRNEVSPNILTRILHRLGIPLDQHNINARLIKSNIQHKPDIIFIVKGNNIYPSTLRRIKKNNPNVKIIAFSNDNMSLRHNASLYFESTKSVQRKDHLY
jgi:hypothetical protein